MKNKFKTILSVFLCLCMVVTLSISTYASENIGITHASSYSSGHSTRPEYTDRYGAYGYSEGNCTHVYSSDAVTAYGYVQGNSYQGNIYTKNLSVWTLSAQSGATSVNHASISKQSTIEWSGQLTFSRGYRHEINIDEWVVNGADDWDCTYQYIWGYYSAISGNTIISGTYTAY